METNNNSPSLVWRSLLYVPANNERFIDKAHLREADAIILDLEDSVPEAERDKARYMLEVSVEKAARNGADVLVRINRPDEACAQDLEAAVIPGVRALMLPKVPDAKHVNVLAGFVDELEKKRAMDPGSILFVPMVESPAALFRAEEIAAAHTRNAAAFLGGEDFAAAAGMIPDPETLFLPKVLTMYAARAAGIMPLGMLGTVADFKDLDVVRETVRRSRRFGFEGASCIHPSVVPVLNQEMRHSPQEVDQAERIVSEYAEAEKSGLGAITVDGKMIDVPVVERAAALLARNRAIEEKEKRINKDPR